MNFYTHLTFSCLVLISIVVVKATAVLVQINTMKTTLDLTKLFNSMDLDTHEHGNKEKLSYNCFSLFTFQLVIRKKLAGNQNLKVVFIVLNANYCSLQHKWTAIVLHVFTHREKLMHGFCENRKAI